MIRLAGALAAIATVIVTTCAGAAEPATPAVLARLPAHVRVTLQNESTGGKIETIEEESRTGRLVYAAVVLKNGRETTVRVSPDGAVVERRVLR